MIIVIVDLFDFIDNVCVLGPDVGQNLPTYKYIQHLINHSSDLKYGIPYFVLFKNKEYIDYTIHDYVKYNPVYDESSMCYIFNNINALFYGIAEILKKVSRENPNDIELTDKLNNINTFLNIAENTIAMDELCECLKSNKM
jgi:hypothetical protein